jgi:hydroxypyruvate reductase
VSNVPVDFDVARRLIRSWYEVGLRAVDPRSAVARNVTWDGAALGVGGNSIDIADGVRVVAIAVGKAATDMAHGLELIVGPRLDDRILLTKDGHATHPPAAWEVYEARHPVPDERGVAATQRILAAVSGLKAGDGAIVLISGGGSALLEAPRFPLSLSDVQETTRLLLRAGAPIQDLNAVRSELSDVKGGGLRRAIGKAGCVSLILSDVLGNDPAVIASGPTIERRARPHVALDLIARYGVHDQMPPAVIELLESARPTIDAPESRDVYLVVGDNLLFLDRIEEAVRSSGFSPRVVLRDAEGEARELANRFVDHLTSQPSGVDVAIGGGEATVTVRGDGRGGRNTEFALAAAIRLQADGGDWVVASLASDGQDGAMDAAGAIVDRDTIDRGRAAGVDAATSLASNDSGGYFEAVGGLVVLGPTGTNVNDVYIGVRISDTHLDR